jgi:hypothetical protein
MSRPRHVLLLSAVAAPALASCAFVLDFDSLQSEKDTPAQGGQLISGGTSGSGGSAASDPGEGGSGACPSACYDDDPCTADGCNAEGGCLSDVTLGLVLDGIDETVPAEAHYRATAVAGDDDFFLSAFSAGPAGPTLTLYRVPVEGGALSDLGTLDGATVGDLGEPSSAAGLAYQSEAGLLHAFVGMKKAGGTGSRLRRFVMRTSSNEMLGAGLIVSESYWDLSPYNHPVALTVDDIPVVAWIDEDQSIGLDGGGLAQPATLSADTDAMALTLVTSDSGQPVVLYGTASSGVFAERPGADPVAVEECQPAPGVYLSFDSAFATVSGYWLSTWTKIGGPSDGDEGYLTTDGVGMFCGGAGDCLFQQRDCPSSSRSNLLRNPATTIANRPGTSAGRVEVVAVTPLLEPGAEPDAVTARLRVTQEEVDFGVPPFSGATTSEELGPPFDLAVLENAQAPEFRGPDWPVVVHVPPDHYLIAWIEPEGGGDSLRVQRYKMCVP